MSTEKNLSFKTSKKRVLGAEVKPNPLQERILPTKHMSLLVSQRFFFISRKKAKVFLLLSLQSNDSNFLFDNAYQYGTELFTCFFYND